MPKRTALVAILMVLASAGLTMAAAATAAASAKPAQAVASNKEPLVIPRLTKAPKIDGVLDNPIWETEALKIDTFVQLSPKENGEPTEKTVAYLGYDEKNLYVAFRAYDSQASKVRCSITKRDGCLEDDWVFIMLDTFNEKRRAFSFLLNPVGVQMDMMRVEEGGNDNMDDSWDTVFLSDGQDRRRRLHGRSGHPLQEPALPQPGPQDLEHRPRPQPAPDRGDHPPPALTRATSPGLLSNGRPFVIQGAVERSSNVEVMPFLTSLKRQKAGDGRRSSPGPTSSSA